MPTKNTRGFTLIELMIVVTIVSVLAALAAVAYTRVTRNQRYSEAVNFIATVHAGQAMYRTSYGRYCSQVPVTTQPTELQYDPALNSLLDAEGGSILWSTPHRAWAECLIQTPSQTRFQYMMMGASAGTNCINPPVRDGTPSLPSQSPCAAIDTTATDWYWITMRGDLDGDEVMSYTHSHSEMQDSPAYRIAHNE